MSQYRIYKYEELYEATQGFSPSKLLGQGGYGPVYKGRLHGARVAIKALAAPGTAIGGSGQQGMREFEREVEVLGSLHHPHLLPLLGGCPERGMLVYELMDGGSLHDMLFEGGGGNKGALYWKDRVRICYEVASALHHLHNHNPTIVHKDVKPSNVMLDRLKRAKLGDVGLAVVMPNAATMVNATTALRGTLQFMDPDYLRSGAFSPKSDTYALGITMLQSLTARQDVGVVEEVEEVVRLSEGKGRDDCAAIQAVIDPCAGPWPADNALRFARLALRCADVGRSERPDLKDAVLPELAELAGIGGDSEDYEEEQDTVTVKVEDMDQEDKAERGEQRHWRHKPPPPSSAGASSLFPAKPPPSSSPSSSSWTTKKKACVASGVALVVVLSVVLGVVLSVTGPGRQLAAGVATASVTTRGPAYGSRYAGSSTFSLECPTGTRLTNVCGRRGAWQDAIGPITCSNGVAIWPLFGNMTEGESYCTESGGQGIASLDVHVYANDDHINVVRYNYNVTESIAATGVKSFSTGDPVPGSLFKGTSSCKQGEDVVGVEGTFNPGQEVLSIGVLCRARG